MPSGKPVTSYSVCGLSLVSCYPKETEGIGLNTMLSWVRNLEMEEEPFFTCCPLSCRSVEPCTTLEDMCPCVWTRSTWSTYQEGQWHTAIGWRRSGYTLGVRIAKGQSTSSMDKPSLGRYVGYWSSMSKCQLIKCDAYLYPRWNDRLKDCSWICEIRRSVPPFSICLLQVDIDVYNDLPLFSRETTVILESSSWDTGEAPLWLMP